HLVRVAEVDRPGVAASCERQDAADQIVHVADGSGLRSVSGDGQRLPTQGLIDEGWDSAPVTRSHTRAVGVEDAHDARVDALVLTVCGGQGLPETLALVVDTPRSNGIDVAPVLLWLRMDLGVAVDLGGRG